MKLVIYKERMVRFRSKTYLRLRVLINQRTVAHLKPEPPLKRILPSFIDSEFQCNRHDVYDNQSLYHDLESWAHNEAVNLPPLAVP